MNDLTNSQKRILGIAYGVNQLTLGNVKSRFSVENGCVAEIKYDGISDLQWPLVAHIMHGLVFVRYNHSVIFSNLRIAHDDAYFTLLDKTVAGIKKSVIDDIKSLIDRDYLKESSGGAIFPRWGYILTEPGYDVGKNHRENVTPFQVLRSGIYMFLLDSHDKKIELFEKLEQSNMGLKEFLAWFSLHSPKGIVTPNVLDEFCDEFVVKSVLHEFVEHIIRRSYEHNKTVS